MPRAHAEDVTIQYFERLLDDDGLKPGERLRVIEALVKPYDRRDARLSANNDAVPEVLRWTQSVIEKYKLG